MDMPEASFVGDSEAREAYALRRMRISPIRQWDASFRSVPFGSY